MEISLEPENGSSRSLLDPKSLKELVADELRRAIVGGRHAPGTQLKQDLVAAQFGVSRMPIREAFLQLEAEGLIEFRRHRVAVVKALSADDIREIFEIRMLLESRAVELGVPNLTKKHIFDMSACHKMMCSFRRWDSEWPVHNKRFHATIYGAAGRTHMVQLIASVQIKLDRYLSLYLNNSRTLKKSNTEHAAILQACREGNAKRAAVLTHKHIEDTMHSLLERFTASSPPPGRVTRRVG
jgi:DNA-binding GntR family transcriptional regulator